MQREQEPPGDPVIGINDDEPFAPPVAHREDELEGYALVDPSDWERTSGIDRFGRPSPRFGRADTSSPERQPFFYVFVAAAIAVGIVAIFFIFRAVNSGGDDGPSGTPAANISIDVEVTGPAEGERVQRGEPVRFQARAAATHPITRFELLVNDRVVATEEPTDRAGAISPTPSPARLYSATLVTSFDRRGEQKVHVRAVVDGADGKKSADSPAISVTVVEEARDVSIPGRTTTATSLRTGPGESFPVSGTIQAGVDVRLIGRSSDSQWLVIDVDGEPRWLPRSTVQESGSIGSLPVRVPSLATPSATTSPTPVSGPPDFVPLDARVVFAGAGKGVLRITLRNDGATFAGRLVIGVSTTPQGLVSPQLTFDLILPGGRAATVDFEILGPLPSRADVTIRLDPGNAVAELNENNNTAAFTGVTTPDEPANVVISAVTVQPGASGRVIITVKNNGGALAPSEIRVRIRIGGQDQSMSQQAALPPGETLVFSFPKFATGPGRAEALVNGVGVASVDLDVPSGGTASATPSTTTSPTGTTTGTATSTTTATGTATTPTATRTATSTPTP